MAQKDLIDKEKARKKSDAAASKTATLAAAAEKEMMELNVLLGKLKTGAATRAEKDRMKL